MFSSPSVCLRSSDLVKQKDSEIMSLLEEKVQLFRGMWEGLNPGEEVSRQAEPFFRSACGQELPRGASVMKDALQEGKTVGECIKCVLCAVDLLLHCGSEKFLVRMKNEIAAQISIQQFFTEHFLTFKCLKLAINLLCT